MNFKNSQEKPLESKTREASIAEFIDRTKHIQDEHPEVDFTKSVIEPTMNLTYDIKENVEEETRKKHESLITLMLQNTGDLVKAEKYLMEARDCLKGYPDILKQFDDIYINKRPVSVMLEQLHEFFALPSLDFININMTSNLFTDMDLFEGLFDGFESEAQFQEPLRQARPPAKVGGRFTRESVRVLRNWLAAHQSHPYPRESERRMLQEQTGLTKTQISNWLANARRRGKIPSSASSPHGESKAMDIPARPGTPAVRNTSEMDPLQRWVDSPPEDEPAAVTAIARAVSSARPLSVAAVLEEDEEPTKKKDDL
ncbi:hypothetical protein CEP51_002681 [Fusarium floridanum]|uniref:Homeobox domain-containing protein n=1 Tax=Fusarium floridanum TaxID=1325733 RepID=A0A428SAE3_9HYPO|nr:hypothetical protein CEP51_002681 [Fusarium floridanum]